MPGHRSLGLSQHLHGQVRKGNNRGNLDRGCTVSLSASYLSMTWRRKPGHRELGLSQCFHDQASIASLPTFYLAHESSQPQPRDEALPPAAASGSAAHFAGFLHDECHGGVNLQLRVLDDCCMARLGCR